MQKPPAEIPIPYSTSPGKNPQESAGRLINCCAEPIGEAQRPTGPAPQKWVRQPGLWLFGRSVDGQLGYRGGLTVGAIAYETWANNASTMDGSGTITSLGNFPGTKKVSIARNQNVTPQVVAVDIDNGAYRLSGGGPVLYNGGGVLPQPNSVCFQDSFFFFTIGDNRCFASGINDLTQNANTFIRVQKKADSILMRGIAHAGLLWLFCSGHCEVWNNTANPFPGFPYSFLAVVNYGLLQPNAIAGFETGFDDLIWASHDFGVYWARGGNAAQPPTKISPPDLDRLIQASHAAGELLEAGCYEYGGKRFWHISGNKWTWEFCVNTQRWNERTSLINGIYTRWRASGGHPGFGRWLIGDTQNGNMGYHDPNKRSEYGAPQLFRVETGPVKQFPFGARICRADFNMDQGIGLNVNDLTTFVTGVVASGGAGSLAKVNVFNSMTMQPGDTVNITGVVGTTEVNGTHTIGSVPDSQSIILADVVFVNAYVSGGSVVDVTQPQNVRTPTAAISCSRDGGLTWGNPWVRQMGAQGNSDRPRITVKNAGLSPPLGARWRIDVTDQVDCALLSATQSSSPLDPGAA